MHGVRMVVNIIGALFSIFLGFVTLISWTNYKDATLLVGDESVRLYIVWESSQGLPKPIALKLSQGIERYVSSIIKDEWPAMASGEASKETQRLNNSLYTTLLKYQPKDSFHLNDYNRAVTALDQATEIRNKRLNMLNLIIPTAWYFMIFLGGFTILTVSVFMLESNALGYYMQALLCLFMTIYLTSIVILSHPLSGILTISKQPYHTLLQNVTKCL
jgi:hypothetical protein